MPAAARKRLGVAVKHVLHGGEVGGADANLWESKLKHRGAAEDSEM